MTSHGWFLVFWGMGASYIVLAYALGWRLNILREQKRAPRDTPNAFNLVQQPRFVLFLFQDRHREIGDPIASTLVIVCRVLFVVAFVGIGAHQALPTW